MTVLYETITKEVSSVGVVLITIAIIVLVIALPCRCREFTVAAAVCSAIAALLIVVTVIYLLEPHKRVQVLLDDDYPAVALYDEYEIVKREGDIWTLDEKKILEEDEGE